MRHPTPLSLILAALMLFSALFLSACGQTGPLTLPDDSSKSKKSAITQTSSVYSLANALKHSQAHS